MAAHFGSAPFSSSGSEASPPTPHHHPHKAAIISAYLSGALFVVIVILIFCFAHRFWKRENRQSGRVGNADVMSTTPPVPSAACKPEVLASLPVFVFSSVADEKEMLECTVCLAEFRVGDKGRALPRCGHRFHAECIDLWLDSHCTCPLCRVTVESESESLESAV